MNSDIAVARKWVLFECQAEVGAEVFVCGEFNKWAPTPQERLRDRQRNGHYSLLCQLSRGEHFYMFQVNGRWVCDPKCPDRIEDEEGNPKCILRLE